MKKILCVSIFIISILLYLLLSRRPDNLNNTKKNLVDGNTTESTTTNMDFRHEIDKWTEKANGEKDIIKSSIYRSYAMSNLYFLQPFISSGEYKFLSIKIGDKPHSGVPRYINPEIVLSIVKD